MPSIVVTGASGFVGRHFLEATKDDFRIFALCRRSQLEAGVPQHPNIKWLQVDIANWPAMKAVTQRIKELGGAEFLLHLAGYYDFNYDDNPEYARTNVNGTRHVLEQAKSLCVSRLAFTSSLAACNFPRPGDRVTEGSPADASFAYARSKRAGEDMVREYSAWFPSCSVRLAAVFSDWCEYPPLYMFLTTWLSHKWNARILGGRGESAVTYIHVSDLIRFFLTIFRKSGALPPYDLYNASPNGSTSHRHLFETATHYYFGHAVRPRFVPRAIAYPGILGRVLIGRMTGCRPFERPWMVRYIDRKLSVDSSYTRNTLGWEPTPRYHVLRRLLFMIEKMKSDPGSWTLKNEAALKRGVDRPNLRISEALVSMKEQLVARIVDYVRAPQRITEFRHYREIPRAELEWYVGIVYRLLMAAVRTGDRALMLQYADDIARRRFEQGFSVEEISGVLQAMKRMVVSELVSRRELSGLEQEIHDSVALTVQLATDEIEDCYERFKTPAPMRERRGAEEAPRVGAGEDLENIIARLDALYEPPPVDRTGAEQPEEPA